MCRGSASTGGWRFFRTRWFICPRTSKSEVGFSPSFFEQQKLCSQGEDMFRPHEHKLGWDQSKVGQVYKALKNLVVNCEVPPRTRLDPTAISNVLKLKTSVTPVREALIQLRNRRVHRELSRQWLLRPEAGNKANLR